MVPVVLFDGDCGFCTWSVDQAQRWLLPRVEFRPYQFVELADFGVTADECATAVQFVTEQGVVSAGAAVARVLTLSRQPFPVLGKAAPLPGLRQLTEVAYRWVAANRYRLPGSTPACALPQPSVA